MRKLTTFILVVAALLACAGTANALERHATKTIPGADGTSRSRLALARGFQIQPAFVPLGATLSGTATLSGHVYASDGAPLAGMSVGWYSANDMGSGRGETTTGYDGSFTLSGAPAANGDGAVWAMPAGGGYELDYLGRTWPDPGPTTFDFAPGLAWLQLTSGGPWDSWEDASIVLYGTDAGGPIATYSPVARSGTLTTAAAQALPGTYTQVAVNYWMNEGQDAQVSFQMSAGGTADDPAMHFEESAAQRLRISTPYWASGKPGTTVKLRLDQFPAGWVSDFYGYQALPTATALKPLGSYTSKGAVKEYKSVKVPATAKAGFYYYLGLQHRDGALSLETPFQVCTLKGPTASRYGGYHLTGKVPIKGYTGEPGNTGTAKWVYLFKRYSAAGQPKGDPAKYGWKFHRRYKTDFYGKFRTGSLSPGRSTWWVIYYPGDDWYYPGFTSVWKVRDY